MFVKSSLQCSIEVFYVFLFDFSMNYFVQQQNCFNNFKGDLFDNRNRTKFI